MRCISCHEPERALEKRKNLARWLMTVRRMANKSESAIPASEVTPIAQYLAFRNRSANVDQDIDTTNQMDLSAAQSFNIFGTVSTVLRNGVGDDVVENQGFFPEVWAGVEWNSHRVITARVTACISCHTEGQQGSRIELAEGLLRYNVTHALDADPENGEFVVDVGRVLVPFGGFSSQSHPGAFRTVTRPLMYNMGQNVNRSDIGPTVLPMPYADEGVIAHLAFPIGNELRATVDAYVVNGLQGGLSGITDFYASRDYVDNNREPAFGARVTFGMPGLKLGGSLMSGKHNAIADGASGPFDKNLNYNLYGFDLTMRIKDVFRVQVEYASRSTDRFVFAPSIRRVDEELWGIYIEGGLRIHESPRIELVVRYDTLDRNSDGPPSGSSLKNPGFNIRRITTGVNFLLPGGSLLLFNYEHWSLPEDLGEEDVLGLRYVVSF
ncbi:MAG: hypothetical protein IH899_06285 [Planctomycetes bacterium]|nr:hypothetical protein [Planctomycetota bacterium]